MAIAGRASASLHCDPIIGFLLDLAQALDIPLRERNTLLLAAGYAPIYSEGGWNGPEMQGVTRALERMLRQHEPFPALVMDRYWNVLMTNEAAPRFFSGFIDLEARTAPRNMLHLLFDPHGMRPFIANWEEVAKGLFQRVYRESVGRGIDERTKELLTALLAYPDVKTEWKNPVVLSATPVIPIGFARGACLLSYFSMVTTVAACDPCASSKAAVHILRHAVQLRHRRIPFIEPVDHRKYKILEPRGVLDGGP